MQQARKGDGHPGQQPQSSRTSEPAGGTVAEKPQSAGPKAYDVVQDVEPQAIVIHCSDPRFQAAFARFLDEELGLKQGQYIPLVVSGGAGALARPLALPKEFKFLKDRIELHMKHSPTATRIILINHQDCKYYHGLSDAVKGLLGGHANAAAEGPLADLTQLKGVFAQVLAYLHLQVELYYAKFADETHGRVTFERVI